MEGEALSLSPNTCVANQLLAYTNKRARDMTEGHTQVERGEEASEERATGSAQAERRLCAGG